MSDQNPGGSGLGSPDAKFRISDSVFGFLYIYKSLYQKFLKIPDEIAIPKIPEKF